MDLLPGPVALLGSGETSPAGGQVFEALARQLPVPLQISVLETPAGFELNSPVVAGRVAEYMKIRLQNYRPSVDVIPARRGDGPFSTGSQDILAPMLHSDLLYMGAGSPSYTVRQLAGSLAWDLFQARHRHGAAVALASAAAVAAGVKALPVYEIYKVGEDPYWKNGLNFLAPFGLRLVIVSHWNNNDGGAELDTSRCFMGRARFDRLAAQLDPQVTILGLDEATGLLLDFQTGDCQVLGRDSVHILRDGVEQGFSRGERFPASVLGSFALPADLSSGIDPAAWQMASEIHQRSLEEPVLAVPEEVEELVAQRQQARDRRDWAAAESLRQSITNLGWKVTDTPEGPKVEPLGA